MSIWDHQDEATPKERRLLDQLEEVRWGWKGRLRIFGGHKEMQFGEVYIIIHPKRRRGRYGVMFIDVAWIRREIKRCRAREKREYKKDTDNHVGAYI